MVDLFRNHLDTEVEPGSSMFKEDHARYPKAPCSHCGVGQRANAPTVWVRPFCHVKHAYERSLAKGGSMSVLCVRCATRLYGYDKRKGLATSDQSSPPGRSTSQGEP